MPVISVIVPVFNGEKTISETIRSILNQTFQDLEILIINDGSTDNTLEILSEFEDERIKIFSYENGGLPVARNRGIEQSSGDFVTFLDADDLWEPEKLEEQLKSLRHNPKAGVSYSWTSFIDENSQFLYAWEPVYYSGDVYPDLLLRNFISSGSNIMIKRSVIEKAGYFDPNLKSVEDWDYYLRLAALCEFAVVPKYHILYRKSSQSMTAKVDVMEETNLFVIERAFKNAPRELQHLKRKTLGYAYRYISKQCLGYSLNQEDIRKSQQKILKALQVCPYIILEKETLRLCIKIMIISLLPHNLSKSIIEKVAENYPMVAVEK